MATKASNAALAAATKIDSSGNVEADTLDGVDSLQFTRSDQADSISGPVSIQSDSNGTAINVQSRDTDGGVGYINFVNTLNGNKYGAIGTDGNGTLVIDSYTANVQNHRININPTTVTFGNINIGVNTSAPASQVHIKKNDAPLGFDAGLIIQTNPTDGTAGKGGGVTFHNLDVYTAGIYGLRETASWNGALAFYTHTATSGNTFGTTFIEQARLSSAGNLGIANTNPLEKLHVSGFAYATSGFKVGSNTAWKIRPNNANQDLAFEYSTNSSLSDTYIKNVFKSNGYNGFGTASPIKTVEVASDLLVRTTGGSGIHVHTNATTGAFGIGFNRDVASGSIFDGTKYAYQLHVQSNALEIEAYNDSGVSVGSPIIMNGSYVGINRDTAAETPLHVNGDTKIDLGKLRLIADSSTNEASGFTVYNTAETDFLSSRITTAAHSRGLGWEWTDDHATASAAAATPYFRVDYTGKYMTIIETTVANLPSSAPAGSIAYVTDDGGNLYYKNANAWKSMTSPLGTSSNPAPSATAIIAAGDSQGDGYYYIKPHASSPTYYVYCDMTTDGGGWMLMINARPNNGGQYYGSSDYGLSTVNGVTGVPEYNKSTTSMFGTTKIADFFKMSGFKYGRMTPGPGVNINASYTGLYQRIGTGTTNFWEGSGNECSLRGTLASRNAWVLVQYQNWSDVVANSGARTGTYASSNHFYPTTYDSGWQNFWKGDQDGIRFSSTFSGEDYTSIGQNTSPGYWWIKSDQ